MAYQKFAQILHSSSETIRDVLDKLLVLFQHQVLRYQTRDQLVTVDLRSQRNEIPVQRS